MNYEDTYHYLSLSRCIPLQYRFHSNNIVSTNDLYDRNIMLTLILVTFLCFTKVLHFDFLEEHKI